MVDNVKMKWTRNTGLDLLRVISIVLIVFGHMQSESILVNIGIKDDVGVFLFQEILGNGERLAINCFVMVSAWFLVGKEFSGERFLKMWLRVFIVNVFITIIAVATRIAPLKSVYVMQAFFPIIGRPQWYMCEYLLLLLFAPFISRLMQNVSRRQHKTILLIGLIFIIFVETLMVVPTSFSVPLFSEFIWFTYLYLLVGYIKFYPDSKICRFDGVRGIWLAIVGYFSIVFFFVLGSATDIGIINSAANHFAADYAALPGFICSLGLFLGLKNVGGKENAIIRCVARNTGYIYMIHAVPVLWRFDFKIWEHIFHISYWYEKGLIYFAVPIILILVVAAGCIIGEVVEKGIKIITKGSLCNRVIVWLDGMYI
ncbi:MAG: acyltransferase [Lachnospiraceae bacterium]|nr:acyltransferase [Lachnospiraceae bacterium]